MPTATTNPAEIMYILNPNKTGVETLMPKTNGARKSGVKAKGGRAGSQASALPSTTNPNLAKEIARELQKTKAKPVGAANPVSVGVPGDYVPGGGKPKQEFIAGGGKPHVRGLTITNPHHKKRHHEKGHRRNPAIQDSVWKQMGVNTNPPLEAEANRTVTLLVKGSLVAIGTVVTEFACQLFLPNLENSKFGMIGKRAVFSLVAFGWLGQKISPFASDYLLLGGMADAAGILVIPYTTDFLNQTTHTITDTTATNTPLSGIVRSRSINEAAELMPMDTGPITVTNLNGSDLSGIVPTQSINPGAELAGGWV